MADQPRERPTHDNLQQNPKPEAYRRSSIGQLYVRLKIMRYFTMLLAMTCTSYAEELAPQDLDKPMPKVIHWKALDKEWIIIEPQLFTDKGSKYIGRRVRFDSSLTKLATPLQVTTKKGTKVTVKRVPKVDMNLLRQFNKSPKNLVVEGTITKVDRESRTIEILAGGLRPSN